MSGESVAGGRAAALTAAVVLLAILLRDSIDASLVGLSLSSGVGLIGRMHTCVQLSIETPIDEINGIRDCVASNISSRLLPPSAKNPAIL